MVVNGDTDMQVYIFRNAFTFTHEHIELHLQIPKHVHICICRYSDQSVIYRNKDKSINMGCIFFIGIIDV